jgi:hypothetical protein
MRMYVSVPVAPFTRVRQDIGGRRRRGRGVSDPEGSAGALLLTVAIMAVLLAVAFWWIVVPLALVALAVWGIARYGEKLYERDDAEAAALEEAKIPRLDAAGCCTVCGAPGEVHVSAAGVVVPVEQWHAAA